MRLIRFFLNAGLLLIYCLYLMVLLFEFMYHKSEARNRMEDNKPDRPSIDYLTDNISKADVNGLTLMTLMIDGLKPFRAEVWNKSGNIRRFLLILEVDSISICSMLFSQLTYIYQAPAMILLRLIIPVVDETLLRKGWNRLLNSIQIIVLPIVCNFLLGCKRTQLVENISSLSQTFDDLILCFCSIQIIHAEYIGCHPFGECFVGSSRSGLIEE